MSSTDAIGARMSSKWDDMDNDSESLHNQSTYAGVSITDLLPDQTFSSGDPVIISQTTYVSFSILLTVIFILGLVQNSLTIYVFFKDKCIRKTHNVFIAALAVSDVAMCIFGVWMVVVSSIFQQWIFGYNGCVYYGFTTTALGLTQIVLLATIALDRYLIIVKPACLKPIQMKSAIHTVMFCYLFGVFWALMPAFGWSSYQLEGIRLRCAINWRSRNPSDMSYLMTLLISAWLIPLCIILFSYFEICRRIRRDEQGDVRVRLRRQQKAQNRKGIKTRDKRVAITVLLMIGAFFLSWTPYSVVTLIVLFGNPDDIPVQVSMVPALCAKSSIIWNPIIYVARHREFRRACLRQLGYLRVLHNDTLQSTFKSSPTFVSKGSPTVCTNEIQSMVGLSDETEPISPADATTSFVLTTIVETDTYDC